MTYLCPAAAPLNKPTLRPFVPKCVAGRIGPQAARCHVMPSHEEWGTSQGFCQRGTGTLRKDLKRSIRQILFWNAHELPSEINGCNSTFKLHWDIARQEMIP